MIDFTGVKAITIPEGSVKKITANGVTLWEKISFVNQIPLSITNTGAQYVGDNGEDGYRKNYRLNSSGNEVAVSASNNMRVTGFIPVKRGDTVYFKNIKFITTGAGNADYTYISLYNSSFVCKRTDKGKIMITSGVSYIYSNIEVDTSGYVTSFTIKDQYNEMVTDKGGYFRISAEGIDENSIITVNQPIP